MEKQTPKPVITHTYPFTLSSTGKAEVLRVSDKAHMDTEIFAHLEYLSEIRENGMLRLKMIKEENGTEENWNRFRSFVRQSKLFYFSAQAQDPSISALNYFYSFENLVKAFCCLHHPDEMSEKAYHGLSTGSTYSDTLEQEITIQNNGIMPLFYQLVTGRKLAENTKIINKKLIPYCTDISFENTLANAKFTRKNLPMKATIGGKDKDNLSLIVAINAPINTLGQHPDINHILKDNFHWVDISQKTAEDALKIPLDEYNAYTFFQGKNDFGLTPNEIVAKDFYYTFFPFITFYPRDSNGHFNLNLPTEDIVGNEIILNEYLSIYILMFYMSELVRYNPKTIQDNLSQPIGWLMERFTINTPQTFLRYMTNLICGKDFIFY